jgi:hypothetical protein
VLKATKSFLNISFFGKSHTNSKNFNHEISAEETKAHFSVEKGRG